MNLHGQIMNLPQTPSGDFSKHAANPAWHGYIIGHRDARHAAAEIALKADRLAEAADDLLRLTPDDSSTDWNVSLMRLRDARNALVYG